MEITLGNLIWGKAQDVLPTTTVQKINNSHGLGTTMKEDELEPDAQDAFLKARADERKAQNDRIRDQQLRAMALTAGRR